MISQLKTYNDLFTCDGISYVFFISAITTITLLFSVTFVAESFSQVPLNNLSVSNISKQDGLLTGIYDESSVSIVSITSKGGQSLANKAELSNETISLGDKQSSIGSGFLIDNDGHVITNSHVVGEYPAFDVRFLDGTIYPATLIGKDPLSDIAVLQINPAAIYNHALKPLPLGSSSVLKIGQQVVAIGNPQGYSGTMTEGIISQLNIVRPNNDFGGYMPGMIQTDAPLDHGSSGGPLINLAGEVIGITSSQSQESNFISFAIPADKAKRIAFALLDPRNNGTYKHNWLGLNGADITPDIARLMGLSETRGVVVTDVATGSPAEKAGISAGNDTNRIILYGQYTQVNSNADVITKIDKDLNNPNDDVIIRQMADVLNYLDATPIGEKLILKIVRDKKVISIPIEIGERPS
jgi:S1-C subfamily serine protease